ncbi:MAG: hypothetical protein EB072_14320, partial [Betaproteobacteria bacterium]|nr:hypothetical protein [Betaproteobacteria bacterium]
DTLSVILPVSTSQSLALENVRALRDEIVGTSRPVLIGAELEFTVLGNTFKVDANGGLNLQAGTGQISAFNTAQFANLSSAQLTGIDTAQIVALNTAQIADLNSVGTAFLSENADDGTDSDADDGAGGGAEFDCSGCGNGYDGPECVVVAGGDAIGGRWRCV